MTKSTGVLHEIIFNSPYNESGMILIVITKDTAVQRR
jgi:hypothetical protein